MPCDDKQLWHAVACALITWRLPGINLVALGYLAVVRQACQSQLFLYAILVFEMFMAAGSRLTMRERVGYTFFSAWVLDAPTPVLAVMAIYAYGSCVGRLVVRRWLGWDGTQWIPCVCEWLIAVAASFAAWCLWLDCAPKIGAKIIECVANRQDILQWMPRAYDCLIVAAVPLTVLCSWLEYAPQIHAIITNMT